MKLLSSRGLLALKWKDKKYIYMLSTKHSKIDLVDTGKQKKKGASYENILNPSCVIEYNTGMDGVDKHDQLLACFPVMRICVKGYKTIAFYLLDMAIFNAHILHTKINCASRTGIVSFRLAIAEELLEQVSLPNYKCCGRP